MLVRACGCTQEFQHYAVDKFRAQRQAKFQRTRCPACVAKLVEAQRLASTLPKKGEAMKSLPPGTQITLTCKPDGTWVGTLIAGGRTIEMTENGPQGLTVSLARRWAAASKPPSTTDRAKSS